MQPDRFYIRQIGCLSDGEIFCQFSDEFIDPETLMGISELNEDVLITRSPCIQACDVQKVRAVYRPELRYYRDVVIASSVGERSLCSLLSGGDYDGELAFV